MGRKKQMELDAPWLDLEGKIASKVLHAPKTGGDPHGEWACVPDRVVGYFLRNVVGTPWADHLALIAAVLSARQRDPQTVRITIVALHARFTDLFAALGIKTINEWKNEVHLPLYLQGGIVPEDTLYTRHLFFRRYSSATRHVQSWLETLPDEERLRYQQFALPAVSPFLHDALSKEKEIVQQQQAHRKAETEAVLPHFAALRAEAHYRYNRLLRLRQAYQQAISQVLPDRSNLPLAFSYDEGDPSVERLHFLLWDRRSFILAPEHEPYYVLSTRKLAERGQLQFADERNELFLEFVKAERLDEETMPEGFWFADLLKLGVLGSKACDGSEQEIAEKQAWLRQWGYGEGSFGNRTTPFSTEIPGLLAWPNGSTNGGEGCTGRFVGQARRRTGKVFIPVESLYAAATFALLALDLLTTTGMRSTELSQVSVSPECLIRLVDDPPPGAKDPSPRIRYVLRLLPKGERTEERHNYGIGKESVRLIEKTAQMLCEHYHLRPGEALPRVVFNRQHHRSHRFQGALPYIFQYNRTHLTHNAMNACIRFLLHGMVFQTSAGAPVVIRPHLLRHAFATYAVNIEGLPLDLVAKWLQQKNLEVTSYYSEMPEDMQVEQHASFVARLATQINIREAILRSPEEIQKQAEAARRRVGMLVPVAGGECTLDAFCPNQFDCIHCPAKAPDPEKRYQVEEKRRWAMERLAYYEREGLVLEAEKMRQLIRACDLELCEMEQIVAYRKDEMRVIQIQPRPKRPS
jgi:integrase